MKMKIFKFLYKIYKENRKLKKQYKDLLFENWNLHYSISCIKTEYEGARGAMEQILIRNRLEEAKYYANIALMYMDRINK